MVEFPMLGKQKQNFATGWTITKVNTENSEKISTKFHRIVFTLTIGHREIDDWNFLIFEQCKINEQLKKIEKF